MLNLMFDLLDTKFYNIQALLCMYFDDIFSNQRENRGRKSEPLDSNTDLD